MVKGMSPWLPVAVRATIEMPELDDLVKLYFRIGFSKEIFDLLAHNIIRTWKILPQIVFRRTLWSHTFGYVVCMWTPACQTSHSKIMGINMELVPPLLL
jgi:hypothetical protein